MAFFFTVCTCSKTASGFAVVVTDTFMICMSKSTGFSTPASTPTERLLLIRSTKFVEENTLLCCDMGDMGWEMALQYKSKHVSKK